ncbi:transport energizing protein, ExbD/TolR family [Bacteroidales bacterium KA00251]|nr:transport energizing protein, ExbD/TolR family [Bacteroidales bacterium KA00251]
MPIRRSSQTLNAFSMASMTDVIFLLLIFFMVLSTLVVPNAIKINLPSSQSSAPNEIVSAKITLTVAGECFLALGNSEAEQIPLDELQEYLQRAKGEQQEVTYAALYADEEIPYKEIVYVLNAANEAGIQLLLATKALNSNE